MKKILTGTNQAEVDKKVNEWVRLEEGSIKETLPRETMVRRVNPQKNAPKNEGEWTVTIHYEPSN